MNTQPKRNSPVPVVPAAEQPAQLELFRMVTDDAYSNAFEFYEAMPRHVPGRWPSETPRNPDGTALPIKREYTYKGKRYALTLAPAYIEQTDGTIRAEFPGVKEELLELVLIKLAMDKGYFTEGKDERASDSFVLFTTIHQIAEELKRRTGGGRSRSYSYAQIREGLQVLAKTKMHLASEDDDDLIFSPIADLGTFTDKSRKHHADIGNATLYIRFNALISQAVLSRSWRQINYERIIGCEIFLARWFRKQLGLRFIQAAPNKAYNIKLSTIIESSGVTLCARLSDNLKQVEQALVSIPDIVARYTVEKTFTVHQPTGRGRVLTDAMILIRPTNSFVAEQIKTNMHAHDLDEGVVTEHGTVMLEPRQSDFAGFLDYQQAKTAYRRGRKIEPAG